MIVFMVSISKLRLMIKFISSFLEYLASFWVKYYVISLYHAHFQVSLYYVDALSIGTTFVLILFYLKYIVWNYYSSTCCLFNVVSCTLTILIYSSLCILSILWFWIQLCHTLPKLCDCYNGIQNHQVVYFMCWNQ